MVYLARLRKAPCVIAAFAIFLLTAPLLADDQGRSKVIGGLAVYLGVLPAAMITGHPAGHSETTIHGGLPSGPHVYHVMVAVFDEASGARIADAEVTARVAPLGLTGTEKVLEPMTIEDTVTYGNFFDMRYSDTYRIKVEIRRPAAQQPVLVEFQYEH